MIVEYLDWLAGGGKIIPARPRARFEVLTRRRSPTASWTPPAPGLRDALARAGTTRAKWLDHQAGKVARGLARSRRRPPEGARHIGAIALACALGYLDLRFAGAGAPTSAACRLARRLRRGRPRLRGDAAA